MNFIFQIYIHHAHSQNHQPSPNMSVSHPEQKPFHQSFVNPTHMKFIYKIDPSGNLVFLPRAYTHLTLSQLPPRKPAPLPSLCHIFFWTSTAFSHSSSFTKIPTAPVPPLFPDHHSLYILDLIKNVIEVEIAIEYKVTNFCRFAPQCDCITKNTPLFYDNLSA